MREVRKMAPTRAGLLQRLRAGLAPKALAAACARLYAAYPHLRPGRDGANVREYVQISRICDDAWAWLSAYGVLAKASASGRIRWALSGLEPLIRLSDKRVRLAQELRLTPKSQSEAGLPGALDPRPGNVTVVLAGDTAAYVARLRALRLADQKKEPPRPALPAPPLAPLESDPRAMVERLLAGLDGDSSAPPGGEEAPEGEG